MQRSVGVAVGAGVASAILFLTLLAAPSAISVLLNIVASLPVFMAGLAFGAWAAALAGVSGMALVGVTALGSGLEGGLSLALSFLAWQALGPTVLVRQALLSRQGPDGGMEWYPPGHMLVWLTGLAAFGLVVVGLFLSGADADLTGAVERQMQAEVAGMGSGAEADVTQADLDMVARFLPGIVAVSFMVTMLVNGALAQALLARSGRAIRPSPAWSEVELPPRAGAAMTAGLAVALLVAATQSGTVEQVGTTVTMLLATPFLLVGLAVVHAVSRRWPARGVVLGLFYVLVVLPLRLLPLVVILGLVENWVGLRRRIAASRPSRGEK
jgi:hypothetical protein